MFYFEFMLNIYIQVLGLRSPIISDRQKFGSVPVQSELLPKLKFRFRPEFWFKLLYR